VNKWYVFLCALVALGIAIAFPWGWQAVVVYAGCVGIVVAFVVFIVGWGEIFQAAGRRHVERQSGQR
jgi:sugar phosphate permease